MAQDPRAGKNKDVPDYPTVCLIGPSGNGKSSLGNVLLGKTAFEVSISAQRGTLETSKKEGHGQTLGGKIGVVDTKGLESNDKEDSASIINVIKAMKDFYGLSVIALVVNATNYRAAPFFPIVRKYNDHVNEDYLMNHLMIVFTNFSLSKDKIKQRKKDQITKEFISDSFLKQLQKEFPNIAAFKKLDKVPCFFIDCKEISYDSSQDNDNKNDSDDSDDSEGSDAELRAKMKEREKANKEKIAKQHKTELKKFYDKAKTYPRLRITINNVAVAKGMVYSVVNNFVFNNNSNNNNNTGNNNTSRNSSKANSGSDDTGCINNNEKVKILICKKSNKIKQCLLKDVKINDLIETKNGFDKVIHIYNGANVRLCENIECIYIKHEFGTISLTKYHLIYVKDKHEPIMAYKLKIGDYLDCGSSSGSGTVNGSEDGKMNNHFSKIQSIEIKAFDVRSIITKSGEFIASGIRVSCYTHSTKLRYLTPLLGLTSVAPQFAEKMEGILVTVVNKYLSPKK